MIESKDPNKSGGNHPAETSHSSQINKEQNPDQLSSILTRFKELIDKDNKDINTNYTIPHLIYSPANLEAKYFPTRSFLTEYYSRQKSGDPKCKVIGMDSGDYIEFSNNPERDEVLFTFGLNGCIACAVVTQDKSGQNKAFMAHLSPLSWNPKTQRRLISRLYSRIQLPNPKTTQAQIYLVAPGEWVKNDEDGKYQMQISPKYRDIIENLKTYFLLKQIEGEIGSIGLVELPYSTLQRVGSSNQGTFQIINHKGQNGKPQLEYILVGEYEQRGKVFENTSE